MKCAKKLRRRSFLKCIGFVPVFAELPSFSSAQTAGLPVVPTANTPRPNELTADLVIIGGGLGGCAAALAAARNGLQVIMTEGRDWIGGRITARAVPPVENPGTE